MEQFYIAGLAWNSITKLLQLLQLISRLFNGIYFHAGEEYLTCFKIQNSQELVARMARNLGYPHLKSGLSRKYFQNQTLIMTSAVA